MTAELDGDSHMRIVSAHHIALYTSHFARMRNFYVETLELPIRGGFSAHGILFLGAGATTIELVEDERSPQSVTGGWNHLAWEVEDLDQAYADLSARGVTFHVPPEDFPPENPSLRIAFFTDPDGNVLELIQPLGDRYPTS
jgi:catechol 2,3-dioxygenase-like lactoylglutathione lyase family enzyme